ncbi:MAG: phosphate ABC transporter permease PstA [Proteobacteria bacterium]|nr:phosphate ABC transporter permease PstA [Pseudomonadota bacterium]MBU1639202.1 phosphate ABC transporter permease PstA [Pseudomonadota bacterium]
MKKIIRNKYWQEGEPFVWGSAAALTLILILTFSLLFVIFRNGIAVYWPSSLVSFEMNDGSLHLGEIVQDADQSGLHRYQVKIANRDLYGLDFKWLDNTDIKNMSFPVEAVLLERQEYGNFHGFLTTLNLPTLNIEEDSLWLRFKSALEALGPDIAKIDETQSELNALNYRLEAVDAQIADRLSQGGAVAPDLTVLHDKKVALHQQFEELVARLQDLESTLQQNNAVFIDASGQEKVIALTAIVRAYQPNSMSVLGKTGLYISKVWELFFSEPRESNTEGGLFPAIFGTIMLIFIMSIFSFPLGVLAGIYLREYAKAGFLVRLVRIAVNNLAGIPSIVYGIFGLAFFVYGIGSSIDQVFFSQHLPAPTFGTGGILWASLTLGLLTVPVVIVSTEEALGAIPSGLRESSFALGSTKFQTLTRILLPMASPGIMTGFILAMARAAGEVAPLMITGVVKLAPSLPLDGNFPFFHLDRKFMHLGFHIYDIGFQSPNVEAAKPMVFVTTLLLLAIVIAMTSSAIVLRNKMKKKFAVTH